MPSTKKETRIRDILWSHKNLDNIRWGIALIQFQGLVDMFSSDNGNRFPVIFKNMENKKILDRFRKAFSKASGIDISKLQLDVDIDTINSSLTNIFNNEICYGTNSKIEFNGVNSFLIKRTDGITERGFLEPTGDKPFGDKLGYLYTTVERNTSTDIKIVTSELSREVTKQFNALLDRSLGVRLNLSKLVTNTSYSLAVNTNKFLFVQMLTDVYDKLLTFNKIIPERDTEFGQYNSNTTSGFSVVKLDEARYNSLLPKILEQVKDKNLYDFFTRTIKDFSSFKNIASIVEEEINVKLKDAIDEIMIQAVLSQMKHVGHYRNDEDFYTHSQEPTNALNYFAYTSSSPSLDLQRENLIAYMDDAIRSYTDRETTQF